MFNETSSDASEAFSIGLSLLSAGLLGNQYDLYDYSANTFKDGVLDERLKEFQRAQHQAEGEHPVSYSPMLTDVIARLLHPDPVQRLKRSEFYQQLLPNVTSIMSMQPFNLQAPTTTNTMTTITTTQPVALPPEPVRVVQEPVRVYQPPPQPAVVVRTQPQGLLSQPPPPQQRVVVTNSANKINQKVTFSPNKSVSFSQFSPTKQVPIVSPPSKPLQAVNFSPTHPVVAGQQEVKDVILLGSKKRAKEEEKETVVVQPIPSPPIPVVAPVAPTAPLNLA